MVTSDQDIAFDGITLEEAKSMLKGYSSILPSVTITTSFLANYYYHDGLIRDQTVASSAIVSRDRFFSMNTTNTLDPGLNPQVVDSDQGNTHEADKIATGPDGKITNP